MTLQASVARLGFLEQQLDGLKSHAPDALEPVFVQIRFGLVAIRQAGAPTRPSVNRFDGPGGTWKVGRFAKQDKPWIGLEWPADAPKRLTDWLISQMRNGRMATTRPGIPENQLWFNCGEG
jgi:hypothetical protein